MYNKMAGDGDPSVAMGAVATATSPTSSSGQSRSPIKVEIGDSPGMWWGSVCTGGYASLVQGSVQGLSGQRSAVTQVSDFYFQVRPVAPAGDSHRTNQPGVCVYFREVEDER